MFRPRIIPVLLLQDQGLVKSTQFRKHRYIGDPINAVKIFNELRADELVFLDINATRRSTLISLDFVRNVGEEARMPFAVGGGVRSIEDIRSLLKAGAEKVVINTQAGLDPRFVKEASDTFGSSTIVVCIDVKRRLFQDKRAWISCGTLNTGSTPVAFAQLMVANGAGELIIQSIERDGAMEGYDIELIKSVATAVDVPVVALGGAGTREHLTKAYADGRANALAAGSMFVYHGKKRGVLINYPENRRSIFGDPEDSRLQR
jgi:Imidazoleglycerol-phosphate synthase